MSSTILVCLAVIVAIVLVVAMVVRASVSQSAELAMRSEAEVGANRRAAGRLRRLHARSG